MEDEHPLKGKFKFRDLPFEKVIDTNYQLQIQIKDDYEENVWFTVCSGIYEDVYNNYKRKWIKFKCRMLQIETSVWEMDDDTRTE